MRLSNLTQSIKPSATLSISSLAKQLQKAGKDIINLSVGEPDFHTPDFIKEAAYQAIKNNKTVYTPVDGIPELKQAISQKLAQDNQLSYSPQEIIVSNGCKQALSNVMLALLNPGDEIIIPAPYWVSYPDMALLAQGKSVFINTTIQQRFKINPEQLEKAITAKTKLVILNSPSNPTGMVYDDTELKALAKVLIKYPDIYIISDDIYEHIRWTGKSFKNIINVCPELKSRVIICHGVSKTYAMTGWRIGYAAGPHSLIKAMTNIQSQYTSNANSIAQYASAAALLGPQDCVREMTAVYQRRHEIIYNGLNKIPGFKCAPAEGAFYAFPDISQALQNYGFKSDMDFAEFLLQQANVAIVPGSAFGNAECIRFSYAADEKLILKAINNIQQALKLK